MLAKDEAAHLRIQRPFQTGGRRREGSLERSRSSLSISQIHPVDPIHEHEQRLGSYVSIISSFHLTQTIQNHCHLMFIVIFTWTNSSSSIISLYMGWGNEYIKKLQSVFVILCFILHLDGTEKLKYFWIILILKSIWLRPSRFIRYLGEFKE